MLEHLGDRFAFGDLVLAQGGVDPAGHQLVEVALRVERTALDREHRLDDRGGEPEAGAGDVDDPPERGGDAIGRVARRGGDRRRGLSESWAPQTRRTSVSRWSFDANQR